MSHLQGSFNYGIWESSQGAKKVEDTQQNNSNHPRGSGFQRGRGYDASKRRPIVCFKCGEEGRHAFECPNYNMQEPKQGEKPRLNLSQAENEEEGGESQVFPNIGENLMI